MNYRYPKGYRLLKRGSVNSPDSGLETSLRRYSHDTLGCRLRPSLCRDKLKVRERRERRLSLLKLFQHCREEESNRFAVKADRRPLAGKPETLTFLIMARAYVIHQNGTPLMPARPAKARILLKTGRAKAVSKEPFTILASLRIHRECSGTRARY